MIKPRKLRPGDKVAAVSLSWGGPATFPHRYEVGKRQFTDEFGVEVVEARHALRDADWLLRNPKARADDLMECFVDHSIAGIISTIGGNESIRLWPYLDLDILRANPKIFLGYSDTTVSHLACFQAGLTSFYGPAFMAGFAENCGMFSYMAESVRRTLFSSESIGTVEPNKDGWTVEHLHWANPENQQRQRRLMPSTGWTFLQGTRTVQGHLIGGCVDTLQILRGTPVWPTAASFEDAILFLETSEEGVEPQYVTRELRSYARMGVLERLAGILFARPGGNIPREQFPLYDQAILDVVLREEGLSDLAIVTQMDFGHTDPMFVLPYGVLAEIDCEHGHFRILESGVVE